MEKEYDIKNKAQLIRAFDRTIYKYKKVRKILNDAVNHSNCSKYKRVVLRMSCAFCEINFKNLCRDCFIYQSCKDLAGFESYETSLVIISPNRVVVTIDPDDLFNCEEIHITAKRDIKYIDAFLKDMIVMREEFKLNQT